MAVLCAAHGLGVTYITRDGPVCALEDVSLELGAGEVVGVVGPSGSGKTTLGLTLCGLLPETAQLRGSIELAGHRIAKPQDWDHLRGRVVTYVPQEPGLALNPVLRAVTQVKAAALSALGLDGREAGRAARKALARAGLDTAELQDAYPHELSGGQRQRVLLARAFLLAAQLVVADEPTSALDAVTQHEILALFEELRAAGSAVLFITHNPLLLIGFARQTILISKGRLEARGTVEELHRAGRLRIGGVE